MASTSLHTSPAITFDQRVDFFKVQMELIQSRFDKFDQIFQSNRKFSITIIAAAFAASVALDQKMVLLVAAGVTIVLFALEMLYRRTLFAGLVQMHLIVRAALNDPAFMTRLIVYDPFNDMRLKVSERWMPERSHLLDIETVIFYIVMAAVPIIIAYGGSDILHR